MIAVIIAILMQLGLISNEQQYNNATPQQQQHYKQIVEDDCFAA